MPAAARVITTAILLALGWPMAAFAARAVPFLEGSRLGITLNQITLPPSIRVDLSSGLTNRILIQVTLSRSGQMIAGAVADIAIKYDLWDENYRMTISVGGAVIVSRTVARPEEVIAAMSNLHLAALFAASGLGDDATLQITAEVLFDPLEKARMEEIRKWVAENSGPAEQNPPTLASGSEPPPPSQTNSLFNRIFEQYASGASVAAAWKDSATSPEFTLRDLRRAGQ